MNTLRMIIIAQLLIAMTGQKVIANEQKRWDFQVFLEDKPIGYHQFSLQDNIVQSTAEFNIKFLFFNAYQYKHHNREVWESGCLREIQSETVDNGEQYSVDGYVDNNQFYLSTRVDRTELDGCVRSFAYWDPQLIDAPKLLNTQTGEYQQAILEHAGSTEFTRDSGMTITATRYVLRVAESEIELWYGPDNDWLALNSRIKGGRKLRYVRQASHRTVTSDENLVSRNKP